MKWFSLLAAAAFLAWGSTAHADPFARPTAAQPDASYPPGYAVPVATSADIDFPNYPPGFSSYRGLGFLGSCCQPCSPIAQRVWDGYCEGNECCEPAPRHSFFKLQRLRAQWLSMNGGWGKTYCDPGVEDGKALEPANGELQKSFEPVPEPAAPDAPAPRATGEPRPNLPSPPTLDRSARRLPAW